jgi:hypothetical protein
MLTAITGLRGQQWLGVEAVKQLTSLLARRRLAPVFMRAAFFAFKGAVTILQRQVTR